MALLGTGEGGGGVWNRLALKLWFGDARGLLRPFAESFGTKLFISKRHKMYF